MEKAVRVPDQAACPTLAWPPGEREADGAFLLGRPGHLPYRDTESSAWVAELRSRSKWLKKYEATIDLVMLLVTLFSIHILLFHRLGLEPNRYFSR
jgi:hypothetical protein